MVRSEPVRGAVAPRRDLTPIALPPPYIVVSLPWVPGRALVRGTMDKEEAEASPSSLMEAAEAKVITKEVVGGDAVATFSSEVVASDLHLGHALLALLHGFFPAAIYLMMTSDGRFATRGPDLCLLPVTCRLPSAFCTPLSSSRHMLRVCSWSAQCIAWKRNGACRDHHCCCSWDAERCRPNPVGGVLSLLVVSGLSAFFGGAP